MKNIFMKDIRKNLKAFPKKNVLIASVWWSPIIIRVLNAETGLRKKQKLKGK